MSTTSPPDYSIIIPAYNEAKLLPQTLKAIKKTMARVDAFRGELIVVDNNSTDATARIAADYGATVVFEPFNQIARARNRGAENACGRFLVFIDADTAITPSLLTKALENLDSGSICGGGALVGTTDSIPLLVNLTLRTWNCISRRMKWAAGSFVYCLRQAWMDSNGFDEAYYASEEIHFSRRLKRWGKQYSMVLAIIPATVDTSMRKFQWYSHGQMLQWAAKLIFFPWLLRSKHHCAVWYQRPSQNDTPQESKHAQHDRLRKRQS